MCYNDIDMAFIELKALSHKKCSVRKPFNGCKSIDRKFGEWEYCMGRF